MVVCCSVSSLEAAVFFFEKFVYALIIIFNNMSHLMIFIIPYFLSYNDENRKTA